MVTPVKGKADYLELGDWNAICFECGRKFKASTMKKHWKGYYTCADCWEPRHPQDYVRGVKDNMTPPWTQPPADIFVELPYICQPEWTTGIPDDSVPDCLIPDGPLPL